MLAQLISKMADRGVSAQADPRLFAGSADAGGRFRPATPESVVVLKVSML